MKRNSTIVVLLLLAQIPASAAGQALEADAEPWELRPSVYGYIAVRGAAPARPGPSPPEPHPGHHHSGRDRH